MKSADIINTLELAGYELVCDELDWTDVIAHQKPVMHEVRFRNMDDRQMIIWAYGRTRYEALNKIWKEFTRVND